jgi:hypothetical protein
VNRLLLYLKETKTKENKDIYENWYKRSPKDLNLSSGSQKVYIRRNAVDLDYAYIFVIQTLRGKHNSTPTTPSQPKPLTDGMKQTIKWLERVDSSLRLLSSLFSREHQFKHVRPIQLKKLFVELFIARLYLRLILKLTPNMEGSSKSVENSPVSEQTTTNQTTPVDECHSELKSITLAESSNSSFVSMLETVQESINDNMNITKAMRRFLQKWSGNTSPVSIETETIKHVVVLSKFIPWLIIKQKENDKNDDARELCYRYLIFVHYELPTFLNKAFEIEFMRDPCFLQSIPQLNRTMFAKLWPILADPPSSPMFTKLIEVWIPYTIEMDLLATGTPANEVAFYLARFLFPEQIKKKEDWQHSALDACRQMTSPKPSRSVMDVCGAGTWLQLFIVLFSLLSLEKKGVLGIMDVCRGKEVKCVEGQCDLRLLDGEFLPVIRFDCTCFLRIE